MSLCFGKREARVEPPFDPMTRTGRRLQLGAYLAESLDAPPTALSYCSSITANAWGIMGNDVAGDCVVAGSGHARLSATRSRGGIADVTSSADALALYSKLTGYDPTRPGSDTGLVLVSFLNWWVKNGLFGVALDSYADPKLGDPVEFKQAVRLFGGALVGVQLRQGDLDAFQAGAPWSTGYTGGAYVGGHCVWAPGYSPNGPLLVTWGQLQPASWGWLLDRSDEWHAPLLATWLNKGGDAVNGVDYARLKEDQRVICA